MRLTEAKLRKIIKEEMVNEIFGFGKKKEDPTKKKGYLKVGIPLPHRPAWTRLELEQDNDDENTEWMLVKNDNINQFQLIRLVEKNNSLIVGGYKDYTDLATARKDFDYYTKKPNKTNSSSSNNGTGGLKRIDSGRVRGKDLYATMYKNSDGIFVIKIVRGSDDTLHSKRTFSSKDLAKKYFDRLVGK